ncbi:MAG TPA: nuclear transport factor 2 family protein [Mucilaginibacter sp.]|jgi:predicted SnoaL-like aldol condensation-catalyzing enzyme|nr:nuclear transport factor 2 family protein [Mucilaginibacter sp.]
MKKKILLLSLSFTILFGISVFAQSQKAMLYSNDATLAKNKKLVYDFWREILEGGHIEFATKYMMESYIQHNPNVPTGRQVIIDYFTKYIKPQPIVDTIKAPLIAIVAEGDLVVLSFKQVRPDPKDKTKEYTTTWFDMLRVENGMIAEHWDPDLKQ